MERPTQSSPNFAAGYLASDDANYWRYEVAPSNQKVALKTIGGVQTVGQWDGAYGFAFVAYAPLIKADKAKEEILAEHGWKKPWSQLVAEGHAKEDDVYAKAAPLVAQGTLTPEEVEMFKRSHDFSSGDPFVLEARFAKARITDDKHAGACVKSAGVNTKCSHGSRGCEEDVDPEVLELRRLLRAAAAHLAEYRTNHAEHAHPRDLEERLRAMAEKV